MSESNEHRLIVQEIFNEASSRYPKLRIIKDMIDKPGDEIPPTIYGSRPDVYAADKNHCFYLIGEAKTTGDLEVEHTYSQIKAFISFLEKKNQGIFILGILGQKSNTAKTILYYLSQDMDLKATILQVYDGLDFWELDRPKGTKWHLI